MKRAYDAVTDDKMGVNRAALVFNVPRTTLKDKVSGRVIHGSDMGPKKYLTKEEEKELVEFLLNCASSEMRSSSKPSETITFSPEMIKKYERWFENGYNIFTNKIYVQWLKKFHPDYLPSGKVISIWFYSYD